MTLSDFGSLPGLRGHRVEQFSSTAIVEASYVPDQQVGLSVVVEISRVKIVVGRIAPEMFEM